MNRYSGTSWNRGVCPRIFAPALVPGQRDNGTSHLGLSQDKGTTGRPILVCPGTFRAMEMLFISNLLNDCLCMEVSIDGGRTRFHLFYIRN